MEKKRKQQKKPWTNGAIFYIKKDPTAAKVDQEWLEVSSGEFFETMDAGYNGMKRYFIRLAKDDYRDDAPIIFLECTESEFEEWHIEKNHAGYLHMNAKKGRKISMNDTDTPKKDEYGGYIRRQDFACTEANFTEQLELEEMKKALRGLLKGLDETSLMLADIFYIESKQKILQKDMAKQLGISPSAVSQRLKVIHGRLQKYKPNRN